MIGRRSVVEALALAPVIGWPAAAGAQQAGALPRIAMVEPAGPITDIGEGASNLWGFLLGALRELGRIEGQTMVVERWTAAGADDAGLAALAAAVVATEPDLIVPRNAPGAAAFMAATATIPIVVAGDLQSLGITLAHPGRNVTGVNSQGGVRGAKALQFLQEAVPGLTRVAWLGPPNYWDAPTNLETTAGADRLGITLEPSIIASPTSESTIRDAFASIAAQGHAALFVSGAPDLTTYARIIADGALALGLPAAGQQSDHARAGLLMSYSADLGEIARLLAGTIDQILDGADPAEIAVAQTMSPNLIVNLRTARALGLTLPPEIMILATEIID